MINLPSSSVSSFPTASKEVLDAFENCLKGEGVDVEELDLVDEKDKVARRS